MTALLPRQEAARESLVAKARVLLEEAQVDCLLLRTENGNVVIEVPADALPPFHFHCREDV